MKITVPPDIEAVAVQEAQKQGTSPEEVVLATLRAGLRPVLAPVDSEGSLADFLAGHVGVLSSSDLVPGGANMSVNCGEKFAGALMEKRKEGRL